MSLFVSGPIRADLLSAERLELKAESIGRDRVVEGKVVDASLLGRVRDNGRVLLRCYRALAAVIEEERATTPAAEWLVDNFHIVEDVVHELQKRRDRTEADRNRLSRMAVGPKRLDETCRVFEYCGLGVPKAVDRLLPIADDKY